MTFDLEREIAEYRAELTMMHAILDHLVSEPADADDEIIAAITTWDVTAVE
jgi:hypothetical protein